MKYLKKRLIALAGALAPFFFVIAFVVIAFRREGEIEKLLWFILASIENCRIIILSKIEKLKK